MDALQRLKDAIDTMLAVSREEQDKPIEQGGNMWAIGYQQGIRAGFHTQITCLLMLQEQVEGELEIQAEIESGKIEPALVVARGMAEMRSFFQSA